MDLINAEKVQEIVNLVYETNDLDSIIAHLNDLKYEIKRDENFVSEIFGQLDDESLSSYRMVLDYLDGALYLTSLITDMKAKGIAGDAEEFVKSISIGWTPENWQEFYDFRSLKYRDPIKCETTDLHTEIDNNAQDEGFEKISDYILENYESVENFCIDSVQSYYCGIIEEYIHPFKG